MARCKRRLNVLGQLHVDHGTCPVFARVQVPRTMVETLTTGSACGGVRQASCVAHGNLVNADITGATLLGIPCACISETSLPCTIAWQSFQVSASILRQCTHHIGRSEDQFLQQFPP